jgi:hypothetical protein
MLVLDTIEWLVVAGLSLFFLEGFLLSVFPHQVKEWLAEVEPRTLQAVGLIETLIAVGLLMGVLFA